MGMAARAILTGDYNPDEFEEVEPIENVNLEEISEEKTEYKVPVAHQTLLPLAD